MKGKSKLAFAFVVLALVVGSFFVFVYPTEAQPSEPPDDTKSLDSRAEPPYSTCGGVQGCRTSCGCGCGGNPNNCGCGG
jgi:hypothetical protein